MKKTIEFLERFHDLINQKHTGLGFIGELEELAAGIQVAMDDAYQAQLDLWEAIEAAEKAKELTA